MQQVTTPDGQEITTVETARLVLNHRPEQRAADLRVLAVGHPNKHVRAFARSEMAARGMS